MCPEAAHADMTANVTPALASKDPELGAVIRRPRLVIEIAPYMAQHNAIVRLRSLIAA